MDQDLFWQIIAETCQACPDEPDEWGQLLVTKLANYSPDQIIEWDRILNQLLDEAYFWDLWGAAYLINGGASDDGFLYFRCWLIGMGRKIYTSAVTDPDSLADVVEPDQEVEVELYSVGAEAWAAVTGSPEADYDHGATLELDPRGDRWDFDDDAEVRRRLPRLAALYRVGES